MKKYIIAAIVCCAVLGLGGSGCLQGGKGESGSSSQDAVLASYSYKFTPVGNPYVKTIPTIILADVESGKQTVTVYVYWTIGEWAELPWSYDIVGVQYEDRVTIGNGFVKLETKAGGVLFSGNALLGASCLVVVKTFNR